MDDYEWFFDTCLDSCPENTEYDSVYDRCNYNVCDFNDADLCENTKGLCFKEPGNEVIIPVLETCL